MLLVFLYELQLLLSRRSDVFSIRTEYIWFLLTDQEMKVHSNYELFFKKERRLLSIFCLSVISLPSLSESECEAAFSFPINL